MQVPHNNIVRCRLLRTIDDELNISTNQPLNEVCGIFSIRPWSQDQLLIILQEHHPVKEKSKFADGDWKSPVNYSMDFSFEETHKP